MTDVSRAILRMLAGNMTGSEIAFALNLEPAEIEVRIRDLFHELSVGTRKALVAAAIERSIIDL
ncbi:MAG: response regulator transcription factor [Blastocatellia bacterium]|nr:response regulator transcription factor [Blastocatellia bacterium]